jgi:hypothetical protein
MFSRGRTNSPKGQMADATWRAGFARLAPLNLTFEAWLYHPQLMELADLARAFPQTTIILKHVGGPLGIGPYADKKQETFAAWKAGIAELGKCQNVVVKFGGLGMLFGMSDFHTRETPPSSGDLAQAYKPYIETCIAAFGPDRGMFESNFPPDGVSSSCAVLWNAFKLLAAGYSADGSTGSMPMAKGEKKESNIVFAVLALERLKEDRSVAVMARALVDYWLGRAILTRLREMDSKEQDAMLDGNGFGPLSTFHAKIWIGYSVGLYASEARDDLVKIKRVRNLFAHADEEIEFADKDVAKLCMGLVAPKYLAKSAMKPERQSPRDRYLDTIHHLTAGFSIYTRAPARRPHAPEVLSY